MGAASGSMACIAAALNNAFSYGNLDTIEVGYGISLRDLSLFAKDVYGGGNVERFIRAFLQDSKSKASPF